MRVISFCFLLLSGCFIPASAQNDSLITALEKSLQVQILELGADHPDIAVYCDSLGHIYMNMNNYAKADSLFNQALDIKLKNKEENHPDVASSYYYIGVAKQYKGDYKKATNFHNKALNIRLEVLGEKHPHVAKSYNGLGLTYFYTSNYEKALVFHNKALNIGLEIYGEGHLTVALYYNNLGNVYLYKSDYEKAIDFYNKALNIRLKVLDEEHPHVTDCYNNLGIVYHKTGDYEKAIDFYNKALNIRLKVLDEEHPRVADCYNNLGIAYDETGDYEKAIDFHYKALNIRRKVFGETRIVAASYHCLGLVYEHKSDYEKAIDFYDKALNIRKLYDENHTRMVGSYHRLAVNYEKVKQYKTADSYWDITIPKITKRLKSTYLYSDNNQRIKYSNTLSPAINDFYSFTAIHGTKSTIKLATDLLLNTKSLALEYAVSTNQVVRNIKDSTLLTQYEQLNRINQQIADTEKMTREERKEKGLDLSEIQDQYDALAFQVLQDPRLKSRLRTKDIKWQDIQNHLVPNEATVDFLKIYEQQDSLWAYYAIIISKDLASPELVRIADEKTLGKPLKTDKKERPGYLYDKRARKAFYKILWQPLTSHLEGIETVHISPSGILHRVPFESLQDENNEYLAMQYKFHYYSAIRNVLKEKEQRATYKDMVLMGHILYDLDDKDKYEAAEQDIAFRGNTRDSIQPLPETLREVMQIKRTAKRAKLKTTMLTIEAASEDTVQYFIKKNAPNIFHFATHGVFLPPLNQENLSQLPGSRDRLRAADNPLQRSALLLYGANETWTKGSRILGSGEDGILTALEVTALDLQNTSLVVLSACSTGLGNVHNTEGVFGLQRAFKLAGVEHVVASLWNVDDEATKNLMMAFYGNLLQKQQDPATALRNAKDELREAGYEPEDWAGFILME